MKKGEPKPSPRLLFDRFGLDFGFFDRRVLCLDCFVDVHEVGLIQHALLEPTKRVGFYPVVGLMTDSVHEGFLYEFFQKHDIFPFLEITAKGYDYLCQFVIRKRRVCPVLDFHRTAICPYVVLTE